MNKRQIIASLSDIANTLDNSGLYKEASSLTNVMKRLAQEDSPNLSGTSDYIEDVSVVLERLKIVLDDIAEVFGPTNESKQFAISEMQRELNSRLDARIRQYSNYVSDDSKPYFLEEAQKLKELAMHRSILRNVLPIEGNFSRLVIPYREKMSVTDLIKEYLQYYFETAKLISESPTEILNRFNKQVKIFKNKLIRILPENTTREQKNVVVDEIEALRLKYIKKLSN